MYKTNTKREAMNPMYKTNTRNETKKLRVIYGETKVDHKNVSRDFKMLSF